MEPADNTEKKDQRQSLKIPPELHREIKVAAARQGREMYTLLEEVWNVYRKDTDRDWQPKASVESPLGDLDKAEAATLSWILEFLRDDSIPDPWGMRRVLLAKGKEWASSKRRG